MKKKVVILGLTGSGKTSVANVLKSKGWPVIEVDEEVMKRNKGKWPESEKVIDGYFAEVNGEILKLESVVFVTSFLEPVDIIKFHKSGFSIIEMHADYDELVKRKKNRDAVSENRLLGFKRNYEYYKKVIQQTKKLMALSIDTTNLPVEEVVNKVEQVL